MQNLKPEQTDQVTGAVRSCNLGSNGKRPPITTLAIGEEGGPIVTTMAVGEEGGPILTTMMVGEEGGGPTPLSDSASALGSF